MDVLPVGTDYPPDHLLARHEHRCAQLLYGRSGTMLVATDDGSWTVPVDRAVLIPPGVAHEVRFLDVTTWSLYIEPDAAPVRQLAFVYRPAVVLNAVNAWLHQLQDTP
ncbi:AraC family ligand binding domain-containing protein [Gryllotalpicola ginsengisoli]|uniref:AraC family ligand binding domain-containing protein n=1 Tax=Gryllotalpicola ginsengisoli TaxID=444608 RepID=UPI0003B64537|nr:AraC family ligand binding domain-containing protein [Gryllotalpicola ginsengisoli]